MKQMRCNLFLTIIFSTAVNFLFAQHANDSVLNFSTISSFQFKKLTNDTTVETKFYLSTKPLHLFIFLSPECPLSKNYTVTLNKMFQQYNNEVEFYGCISGKGFTDEEIQSFNNTYKILFPLFVDESKKFTNYISARVTPEVILLNKKCELVYKGAIDDWVQDLGTQKLTVSKHYLQDAIAASLNHKEVPVKRTKAIGCLINDY
jgi:hypothetical protein